MRIAQRIIQKRRAIVDDIDGKAVLRFDSFQPLYGDGGSVFQAGSDRTDVILKRAELVFGKAAFGNVQIKQRYQNDDCDCCAGTQDGKKKMCFLKHKNLLNPFREKGH